MSSAASIILPEGVVSVLDDVFVAGVEGIVPEKVTRSFVGLDLFAFVFGILLMELTGLIELIELTELFKDDLILSVIWAKNKLFFCGLYLHLGICVFAINLEYLC